jgi:hypothetical protein
MKKFLFQFFGQGNGAKGGQSKTTTRITLAKIPQFDQLGVAMKNAGFTHNEEGLVDIQNTRFVEEEPGVFSARFCTSKIQKHRTLVAGDGGSLPIEDRGVMEDFSVGEQFEKKDFHGTLKNVIVASNGQYSVKITEQTVIEA